MDGTAIVKQLGTDEGNDLPDLDLLSFVRVEDAKQRAKQLNLGHGKRDNGTLRFSWSSLGFFFFQKQAKWWCHHKAARILSLTIIMVTSFKYSTLVSLVPRRCRSIAEMLTERAMLQDVPPSDRVLAGAKNLLLKYALCNLVRQAAQE